MQNQTFILADLVIAPENVRYGCEPDDDIPALAELIAANGLQEPLLGYRKGKTKFAVYDGRRRLLALRLLAKANRLPGDCLRGIDCRVGTKEQARQASLAVGVSHKRFHPAQEYKAFAGLIDDGKTVEDVAKTFCVTENNVLQRLKLARLAPCIFEAFAKDEISLAQAQAYALTDDQDWQSRLYATHGARYTTQSIRSALTENEIHETDKRARYVGAEAYEAAGGVIRRDLFEESPAMFCDAALLTALADAKLEADAVPVKAEGWSFVVTALDFDQGYHQSHFRVRPQQGEFSEDDQKAYDALAAQRDALWEGKESAEDLSDEAYDEIERLEERMDEMDEKRLVYTPEDMARGGAVVSLSHHGEVQVTRGLVERKTIKKSAAKSSAISHSQHRRATEIATQALARDLAKDQAAADIVLTAALIRQAFAHDDGEGVGVAVSGLRPLETSELSDDPVLVSLQDRYSALVGADLADTIECIAELTPGDRAEAKALAVAASLDFTEMRHDQTSPRKRKTARAVAKLTGSEIAKHWIADDAFFAKLSREAIIACLKEMEKDIRGLTDVKKKELVVIAVREAKARNWTPEAARIACGLDTPEDDMEAQEKSAEETPDETPPENEADAPSPETALADAA